MDPRFGRFARAFAVVAVTAVLVGACGGDDDSASTSTTSSPASESTSDGTDEAADEGGESTGASSAPEPLTGEELCAELDMAALAAIVDRPLDGTEADQIDCIFSYPAPEYNVYFLTFTVERFAGLDDDMQPVLFSEGATAVERFDQYVASLDGTPTEFSAGDKAVIVTPDVGPVSGAVLVGDHIISVDTDELALDPTIGPVLTEVANRLG